MNCLELMTDEHKYIKRMLVIIRKYCYKIIKNEDVQYEDFFSFIDFVRNYADKHHHGKEEILLFDKMIEELGTPAEKLVKHGMLVEHDLGRLYMQDLESAVKRVMSGEDEARLDVIANAISYTHLLYRHIDKEDNVVFRYAQNNISKENLEELNQKCAEFEQAAADRDLQKKYIDMVAAFEAKV